MSDVSDAKSQAPLWIRAAVDAEAFQHEQVALARFWNFVGCLTDLSRDGDWFRTTLGGRSIFVQRFGEEIRAFENRCAHRFFPLRTTEKGNGPILCGFHHWRYNQDGQAIGIPKCPEMFGKIPREMDARIERLDVETCGNLIFARVKSEGETQSLETYLGEGYAILKTLCSPPNPPHRVRQSMKAHWKFSHHISLDDYHIVAVHPSSFGKQGYLKAGTFQYYRFGPHSAHFSNPEPDYLRKTARDCKDGTYRPEHYAIYNIFPNLVVTQFRVIDPFKTNHWFANVVRYVADRPDTSRIDAWFMRAPLSGSESKLELAVRPWGDRSVLPIVAHFAAKIMREDNGACESQQSLAREVEGEQMLSSQEMRVGWFEEAYAAALTGQPLPSQDGYVQAPAPPVTASQ